MFGAVSVGAFGSASAYLFIPFVQETTQHPPVSRWRVVVLLVFLACSMVSLWLMARASWAQRRVHGPVVNGTARVLGVKRNLLESASDALTFENNASRYYSYRVVNLQVDVPGREPYDATRNGNFFFKRPAVGQVYLVEVSAADPTRFRVLWKKPIPGQVGYSEF